MTLGRTCASLLAALAVSSACTDSTAPPLDGPENAAGARYPTEEQFAEMPSDFRTPPNIFSFDVTAGFVPGYAYATALMYYWANYAKVTITLRLMRGGTQIGSPVSATEVRSNYLPWHRSLSAAVSMPVPDECGHTATAYGQGLIRHEFPMRTGTWFRWGEQETGGADAADQPPCSSTCPTGSTGGENGSAATSLAPAGVTFECSSSEGGATPPTSGYWVAVTTTTCYGTHYFDASGRYLYSVIEFCETTTSYYFQAEA